MKISLMYVRAGGGHLAAAQALADKLNQKHPQKAETVLYNGLEPTATSFKKTFEQGYSASTNYLPSIWKIIYGLSKLKPIQAFEIWLMARNMKPFIRDHILSHQPDRIVILHFSFIKPVGDVLREQGLDIPVIVVITDPFTCHPIWFSIPDIKNLIVFSPRMQRFALEQGVAEKNIKLCPVILRKKFSKRQSSKEIADFKKKLGFSKDKKLILLAGGGEGIRHGERFLKRLLASDISAEFAMVCGRNKLLAREARRVRSRYPEKKVEVYGFIDWMYELMSISDLVITKGGPATVMEALILKKPLIITSFIWEQEKGNVEFVEKNQLGFFEPNPQRVVEKAKALLFDKRYVETFKRNISRLDITNGTTEIAEEIWRCNGTSSR